MFYKEIDPLPFLGQFRNILFVSLIVLLTTECAYKKTPPENNSISNSNMLRLTYNNPNLNVDLATGLYSLPLPMDYDNDGDMDLVVSSPDQPYNGTYFFENTSGNNNPVFQPAKRIGKGYNNIQISYHSGSPHIIVRGIEFKNFRENQYKKPEIIYENPSFFPDSIKSRAEQWKYVDYEGDGDLDIVVGIGDWAGYGWDNAYDKNGNWQNGPLHGYIFLIINKGTNENPAYAKPKYLLAGNKPIDVFGRPSPNFADFDGDGDLDIICGEFLDKFTWFENKGSREHPIYSKGEYLKYDGQPITMDLQMIAPVSVDWDHDGDQDLIVGEEGGKVAFVENTGKINNGQPAFLPPVFFQQKANYLKTGSLVTPVGVDWDNDGDQDIVAGNSSGHIVFFENLDGGYLPKWNKPQLLKANGKTIEIKAGNNGSIQGPAEAKWGYTTLSVKDWDNDGLKDLIVNSIFGKVIWYKNIGSRDDPRLAAPKPIKVEWKTAPPKPSWNWWNPEDHNLVTEWRTTPAVVDLNHDKLPDLVMLDHEGYLSFFKRVSRHDSLTLLPGKKIFSSYHDNGPLRLSEKEAGGSGRRKLCLTDWDQDGDLDLLINSKNVNLLMNVSKPTDNSITFLNMGQLDGFRLAGHTTSPTVVDWNQNGIPDLVVGAEDGHLYYMENSGY